MKSGRRSSPEIPRHLRDPDTGGLRYCPEAIDLVARRLEADPYASLREALRGLEFLFGDLFRNLNFSGASFRAQDLTGMNFEGCDFSGAEFHQTLIRGAAFRSARISRADLTAARDWTEAATQDCARHMRDMGTQARPARPDPPLHPPWSSFSEAHHAPELTNLPADLPIGEGATEREREALREGRLAIGTGPVLRIELCSLESLSEACGIVEAGWREFLSQDLRSDPGRGAMAPAAVSFSDAQDFAASLNHQFHAGYALPSAALLQAAHAGALQARKPLKGGAAGLEFVRDERGRGRKAALRPLPAPSLPAASVENLPFRVIRIFERPEP